MKRKTKKKIRKVLSVLISLMIIMVSLIGCGITREPETMNTVVENVGSVAVDETREAVRTIKNAATIDSNHYLDTARINKNLDREQNRNKDIRDGEIDNEMENPDLESEIAE